MHYFGGKFRVGKHIAEYINSYSNQYNTYWEPFKTKTDIKNKNNK